jgi:ribosomal protein L25 (general stress protein Ctc)
LKEFHLPSAVDAATQNEECKVKVLKKSGKWRGIAYPGGKLPWKASFTMLDRAKNFEKPHKSRVLWSQAESQTS